MLLFFLKNFQKFIKSMYSICAMYDIIIENREEKCVMEADYESKG